MAIGSKLAAILLSHPPKAEIIDFNSYSITEIKYEIQFGAT